MTFSSLLFILFFLPLFLITFLFTKEKYKDYVILLFSVIFIIFNQAIYIPFFMISSLINHHFISKISPSKTVKDKKIYLLLISLNILALILLNNFNDIIKLINNLFNVEISSIKSALSVLFYTLLIISYATDVYKNKLKPSNKYTDLLLYLFMFPKFIYGPFIKYSDFYLQLKSKKISSSRFSEGFLKFTRGLFKKVLIANNLRILFITLTSFQNSEISILSAWLSALTFILLLYFELSSYSDMAIGISKIIGINLIENFNYPFISKNFTDFIKRFNISLLNYFKEYIYIPLKGSRCKKIINTRNILIVWIVIILVHSINITYLIGALFISFILILEKYLIKQKLAKRPDYFKHIYTIILILLVSSLFMFTDIFKTISYIKIMFGFGKVSFINSNFIYYFKNYLLILVIAIISVTPLLKNINILVKNDKHIKIFNFLKLIIYIIMFILSIAYILNNNVSKFILF